MYEDQTIDDLWVTRYGQGRVLITGGNRGIIKRPRIYGGSDAVGSASHRHMGGTFNRIHHTYYVSGDDAGQLVQAGSRNDPFFDWNIEDTIFSDCWLESTESKAAVAGLQFRTGNDHREGAQNMTASTVDSGWERCRLKGAKWSIRVNNGSSAGNIDVFSRDCVFDFSASVATHSEVMVESSIPINETEPLGAAHLELTGARFANELPEGGMFLGTFGEKTSISFGQKVMDVDLPLSLTMNKEPYGSTKVWPRG